MRIAATIFLGLAVAVAPVAVGAVHTPVIASLLAILVFAGLSSHVASIRDGAGESWLSLPAIACFLLAGWSALQLVPLPGGLLGLVQSEGARIFEHGWGLANGMEQVPWRPISMDPVETADRGLRWLVLGLGAWVAANLPDERRWRPIYLMVLAAGVAALTFGGLAYTFDRETIFGLYEPTIALRGPSPFVSTNHAASFYGLCGVVGFGGLALRRENHPFEASFAGALGLIFVALAAVHDSDAVMAALGLAVIVFVVGLAVRVGDGQLRELVSTQAGRLAYGAVAAVCLLLIGWWVGAIDAVTGLVISPIEGSESALNRTEITLAALAASKDYIWMGAGGGAVDVTVGRYIDWSALRPASIPVVENDPAEWLLTYGWFAGGAAIACFLAGGGFILRRLVSSTRGERWIVGSALCVFGGGIALFHFPFFALGVSLPLLVAIDGVTAPRRAPDGDHRFSRSGHVALPKWASVAVLVAAIVGGAGFVWANSAWSVSFDDDSALDLVVAKPSDGRVFAELSSRNVFEDADRAVEFARWSEELDRAPDSRVFLARMLGKTGNDDESARVYASLLASPIQGGMVRYEWVVRDLERPADRAKALAEASGVRIEGMVRTVARIEGPEAATDLVLELSDLRSDDPAVHRAAIDTFVALGALDLAELWASSVDERGVSDEEVPLGPILMAKVALRKGESDRAREIAATGLGEESPGEELALIYLRVLPDVTDADADPSRVERARDLGCQSPLPGGRRKPCWVAEAWLAERAGELDDAELIFQRIASRLDVPSILAQFWVRHGRCLELKRYVEGMSEGAKKARVERISKSCRS